MALHSVVEGTKSWLKEYLGTLVMHDLESVPRRENIDGVCCESLYFPLLSWKRKLEIKS
jgi:hypothetical protein